MERRNRVTYLDNLRILLTILVIVHHVAASYGEVGVWYYTEPVSGPVSAIVASLAKFLVAAPLAVGLLFASAHYIRQAPLLRQVLE